MDLKTEVRKLVQQNEALAGLSDFDREILIIEISLLAVEYVKEETAKIFGDIKQLTDDQLNEAINIFNEKKADEPK
jgi:hypothetical protein